LGRGALRLLARFAANSEERSQECGCATLILARRMRLNARQATDKKRNWWWGALGCVGVYSIGEKKDLRAPFLGERRWGREWQLARCEGRTKI
jgi:hypothetical protein